MMVEINIFGMLSKVAMNWDLAQFPSWPQMPTVSAQVDIHALFIPYGSPYPEEAMEVIKALTSKESQMTLTKNYGQMTVMTDSSIKNAFGQNMLILKGKHIEGILKSKTAPYPTATKYDGLVKGIIDKYYRIM